MGNYLKFVWKPRGDYQKLLPVIVESLGKSDFFFDGMLLTKNEGAMYMYIGIYSTTSSKWRMENFLTSEIKAILKRLETDPLGNNLVYWEKF